MDDHQAEFVRVHRIVKRFLGKRYDTENIASEIWLESWQRGRTPSFWIIRNRCYDELRRRDRERQILSAYQPREHTELDGELGSKINLVFRRTELSRLHKSVVYAAFYEEKPAEQIATELGESVGRIRATLVEAIELLKRTARGME